VPHPPIALSRQAARVSTSAIRDLLKLTSAGNVISLAGGLPALELLPGARIAQAAQGVLANPGALQYTETRGLPALIELIARREGVGAAQVVVTTGSQQALDLLARALLNPGDTVVVEAPAYPGALQVFQAAGARLAAVPLDGDGMDIGALEQLLAAGPTPALVHTVASFHNPQGVTMSAERRARLAELAERHGFLIVEDNPYGELWFDAPPPAPIPGERVIRLGSASKILAPALRTGWLTGPEPVCAAIERLKQAADLCGSALNHAIAAELLADEPWLAAHLAVLRTEYGARAKALTAALREEFDDALAVSDAAGGMFCWAQFRDGTDTSELLTAALEQGVAFVPGRAFGADGTDALDSSALDFSARMSFAHRDADTLREAAHRLRRAHSQAHTQL
jgi:2-aminoadipate transaminase